MRTRRMAAAASLALVATLAGCGGDDESAGSAAPDNASTEDFCEGFNDLFQKVMSEATSEDASGLVTALKSWAADMEEIGTPEDMPAQARHGFEVFLDQAEEIDDDATLEDLADLGDDLSADDEADGEAFSDWAQENCPLDLPGVPGMDPSDLPSMDPSELASMDPEDMESMMSDLESQLGDMSSSP